MKRNERAFTFTTISAHIVMFIRVGSEPQRWTHIEFVFAYIVCFLIFVQFLIRYLAIIHLYNTETSIASWLVSFFVLFTSLVLIESTLHFPFWFLVFGLLLLLGALKTIQSRKRVIADPDHDVERGLRLQEFMVMESAFGIFMILLFFLTKIESRRLPQLTPESSIFYGLFFVLYYALVSTTIIILRIIRSKPTIDRYMKEQL